MWKIEVKKKDEWYLLATATGVPYEFKNKDTADDLMNRAYPVQVMKQRHGNEITVRVVKV